MVAKKIYVGVVMCAVLAAGTMEAPAREVIQLTLDSAVDIAMSNSYRIKSLQMDIQRTQYNLAARRAALKSKVHLNLKTPDLKQVSDYKWNSLLYRDEIVRQNTQLWQGDLSISQPVILFGYPTDGYVSLNYKMYRYLQKDIGLTDIDYYNRLYLKFEQPFFRPNNLKNNLEEAELNLEESQLRYIADRVGIIWDISRDYYDILRLAHRDIIHKGQLDHLQRVLDIARGIAERDTTRIMDMIQSELEIANVQEEILSNQTNLRRNYANIKQKLRLPIEDSLFVTPSVEIMPIQIDLDKAIEYGYTLSPSMRRLAIGKRQSEIRVEDQKGRNAFHLTLEVTYGLEKRDEYFTHIWEQYDNSNSVTMNAYVPLWDWGERRARIQAQEMEVKKRDLNIEERKEDIEKNIINAYTNLKEYQTRALNMEKSVDMAEQITQMSIAQYENQEISLQDLLQIIGRHKDTEINFINTYLGYRRSLLSLVVNTYYNYEKDMSLLEEFQLSKEIDTEDF